MSKHYCIGSHLAVRKGDLREVVNQALEDDENCVQFFLGSNKSINRSKITHIEETLNLIPEDFLVISHFPYTANLAGLGKLGELAWNGCAEVDNYVSRWLNSLSQELFQLSQFPRSAVVIHPGSFKRRIPAMKSIAMSINKIDFPENSRLYLENCAGEGNKIFRNLSELKMILDRIDPNKLPYIGVCLDTAHTWGVGDIDLETVEGVQFYFDSFKNEIGDVYNVPLLIHLNDSLVHKGAKKDRHAFPGEGYIWKYDRSSLERLLEITHEREIPVLVETGDSTVCRYIFERYQRRKRKIMGF